ncbi:MAG: glycosyltransferase family 39 protein [Candidatus Levybacteria bacterium]|nr:glycosyltransferase family 39 protein [Candidatus Levybacteria bacterium]
MLKHFWQTKFILLIILLLGAFLRFYNIDWDQGQHLHPDERFLTIVSTSMLLPASFIEYLSPQTSTFNPANIGHAFYVYGTLPLVVNKLLALGTDADNYMDITLQGRILSGFADLLVIVVIFKVVQLFERRHKFHHHIKYWSAFFYAIAVLPIQLSHFFAVDTFLTLFAFTSFYFALRFSYDKSLPMLVLSAVFFGLAIGSKISAIYIAPLLLFFIVKAYMQQATVTKKQFSHLAIGGLTFALIAYVVGRIADPYLFQNGNFVDPTISSLFLNNLQALRSWSTPEALFPPSVQWVNKLPLLFPLTNIVLLGLGVAYTFFVIFGIVMMIKKYNYPETLAVLLWMLLFFLYQGVQFSTTMRYFLPLYPFLAIVAAIGFFELTKRWSHVAKAAILLPVIIWPMLFFSIYTQPHSRNLASEWIHQNIPSGSILLSEHWDDSLPLSINAPSQKVYTIDQLPVFDPDSPEKWTKMDNMLRAGDYLILSSNRGWGSIPTVPARYPQMTAFYDDLFRGETRYKKVAEFTSYPSLQYLGIPVTIGDDWAEEAFTVYDHPKVLIFKNTAK